MSGDSSGVPNRAVTLREVADLAGVSVATASNALSGTRKVGAQTVQRVVDAAAQLGYRRNEVARSLRTGLRNTIGVVVPDVTNPFFSEIVKEIEGRANALHWSVVLCNTSFDIAREASYLARLISSADGVLLFSTAPDDAAVDPLIRLGVPVVAGDEPILVPGVGSVVSDNEGGALLAARHLYEAGGRVFGLIDGPPTMATARARVAGFLRGLESSGLTVAPEHHVRVPYSLEGGREGMRQLLQSTTPVDAVFTCTDMQAIGAVFEAVDRGRRIPDDLLVCGFDDISWSSRIHPSLTTLHQDAERIARRAFDMLVSMILEGAEPSTIVLPVDLVERESTRRRPG
ncbi:LacI family DNA-binding transcriptional regulator [Galbitalea sp. SE-J8]|uniref:LacI family DNA-binding transcriptional regulator n=1 Tax=Galbitalea sp. SE-J8 TaxID=3054952 RepID=UPI00259CC8BE|nr:LacI family DNA-binding transcriptional regulator [Galbitalea sp. SE-J8]MDM4764069.1 LacI family DNA-binding transcriptional regulator [Galbitalea sp. SE-J8]